MSAYPSLVDALGDGGSDDLSESGSPFGPGDHTGAQQWGVTLAPATSVLQSGLSGSFVIDLERVTCPGDIAPHFGDGMVDVADLLEVLSAWGGCG